PQKSCKSLARSATLERMKVGAALIQLLSAAVRCSGRLVRSLGREGSVSDAGRGRLSRAVSRSPGKLRRTGRNGQGRVERFWLANGETESGLATSIHLGRAGSLRGATSRRADAGARRPSS